MVQLEQITRIEAPIERCFDLARSVEVHLQGNVHSGEQTVACGGVTRGLIGEGQQVTWRGRHFGIWQTLTSQITVMNRPALFQDAMIRGPFRLMRHDHFFRSLPSGATEMKDVFSFAAPFGLLGLLVELLVLRRHMQNLLTERNTVIKEIAETHEWRKYLQIEKG